MPVETVRQLPSDTTLTGTDLDSYFPSGGGWLNTKGASSVALITHRTAQAAGATTLQPFVEFLYEPTNTFYPLLDANNATAVAGVVYADTVLDASTPFHRFLVLQEAPINTDADGHKLVNTVHSIYQIWIPEKIRYRFRSGGTDVWNTFSALCLIHTAKAW